MDVEQITQVAYERFGRSKSHRHREVGHAFYHGQSVPHALEHWEKNVRHDDREPFLNYELSRRILADRRGYYNSVLERLQREAGGHVPEL